MQEPLFEHSPSPLESGNIGDLHYAVRRSKDSPCDDSEDNIAASVAVSAQLTCQVHPSLFEPAQQMDLG